MRKLFLKSLILVIMFTGCSFKIKKHITLDSVSLVSSKQIKEAYKKYSYIGITPHHDNQSCLQQPLYRKNTFNQHRLLSDLFLAINFSSKEKIFYDYAKEDADKESQFPQYIGISGKSDIPKNINFCPILKSVKGDKYNYLYFYPTKSKDSEGMVYQLKGDENITFDIAKSGYIFMERAMNTNKIVITKEILKELNLP